MVRCCCIYIIIPFKVFVKRFLKINTIKGIFVKIAQKRIVIFVFYIQLEKLCKERGEKITPLVKELGLSPGGIGRWQNGVIPNGETLLKFAEHFGVSTDYLLGNTDDPTPPDEKENTPEAYPGQREKVNKIVDSAKEFSEDDINKIIDYIAFVKSQSKQ